MPAFVDTGLNFVHVDDVAAGHVTALRQGRIGERYILGGENVTLRQLLTDIAACRTDAAASASARRALSVRVRRRDVARVTGGTPFATVDGLRMSRYHMYFNDAKARGELGYRSRPYREGIFEAIDWFTRAGYMKKTRELRRVVRGSR